MARLSQGSRMTEQGWLAYHQGPEAFAKWAVGPSLSAANAPAASSSAANAPVASSSQAALTYEASRLPQLLVTATLADAAAKPAVSVPTRCYVCGVLAMVGSRTRPDCLHCACSLEHLWSLESDWVDFKVAARKQDNDWAKTLVAAPPRTCSRPSLSAANAPAALSLCAVVLEELSIGVACVSLASS